MRISFNAREEFATLAEAAGTSIEKMLEQAAKNAVAEGEEATKCIEHDEAVISDARMRIQRSQLVLKKATKILNTVKAYV